MRAGESSSTCVYYNARSQADVPSDLVGELFPDFIAWSEKLKEGGDWPQEKQTEKGTLELFEYLRLVLLRGAAALRGTHPDFALFSHWPFNGQRFISWSESARKEIGRLAASDESSRVAREASPAVAREIARVHNQESKGRGGLGSGVSPIVILCSVPFNPARMKSTD